MKCTETKLPGVYVIEPKIFKDHRGFFLESYQAEKYREAGIRETFVQDNHSASMQGTLRGLHLQMPRSQGKLLRVLDGEIYDVAVDVRKGSPHFGEWVAVTLSSDNFKQLYVPPGMAHGFCVVSDQAQVEYKCTDYYYPEDEISVMWNDPDLAIPWPTQNPILSVKDKAGVPLKELMDQLPTYKEVVS